MAPCLSMSYCALALQFPWKKLQIQGIIFPGKFPGKWILDGKFPVSREAKNPGNLQTLACGTRTETFCLQSTRLAHSHHVAPTSGLLGLPQPADSVVTVSGSCVSTVTRSALHVPCHRPCARAVAVWCVVVACLPEICIINGQ